MWPGAVLYPSFAHRERSKQGTTLALTPVRDDTGAALYHPACEFCRGSPPKAGTLLEKGTRLISGFVHLCGLHVYQPHENRITYLLQ